MVDFNKVNEEGIDILNIIGEVDASSSIMLDEALRKLISESKKIIIDCKSLDYISSAGLGVFMSYIEEIKKEEISMVLCNLNPKVTNVFQILGLDQLLTISETREEGKKVLNEL